MPDGAKVYIVQEGRNKVIDAEEVAVPMKDRDLGGETVAVYSFAIGKAGRYSVVAENFEEQRILSVRRAYSSVFQSMAKAASYIFLAGIFIPPFMVIYVAIRRHGRKESLMNRSGIPGEPLS